MGKLPMVRSDMGEEIREKEVYAIYFGQHSFLLACRLIPHNCGAMDIHFTLC